LSKLKIKNVFVFRMMKIKMMEMIDGIVILTWILMMTGTQSTPPRLLLCVFSHRRAFVCFLRLLTILSLSIAQ